jgi:hypothetical protein
MAASSPRLLVPKPRGVPRSVTVEVVRLKMEAPAPAGPGLGEAEPSV